MAETMKVADVVFRDDLYPRIKTDPALVQRYADNLDVLPPIIVNQHNELVDGWHRWTAHRQADADEIACERAATGSDMELLLLAIQSNAAHGWQLDEPDKRENAERIYLATPERERPARKLELAKILSVTERMINYYLSEVDRKARRDREATALAMWQACYTREAIAAELGISDQVVRRMLESFGQFGRLSELPKTLAMYQGEDDAYFAYDVWVFRAVSNEVAHPGNSEVTIVDRLMRRYTAPPKSIVVDPFAGGGSTIDICRKRSRRYWASDLSPKVAREKEIRQLDVVAELPALTGRWGDVGLVYLDPPYWRQATGDSVNYGDDPANLANMELDDFHSAMVDIIRRFANQLQQPAAAKARGDRPAAIAMLMQPTQWRAPDRQVVNHPLAIAMGVAKACPGLPLPRVVQCPYPTQQANAQMVEWAKANNEWLVISRSLTIWEVGK